jgi:hypothetical protein
MQEQEVLAEKEEIYRLNCLTRSYLLNSNPRLYKLYTYSFTPI